MKTTLIRTLALLTLCLCLGVRADNNREISLEDDFRYISFEDISTVSDKFTDENVTFFSRLLFDIARDQVIVGARDSLYRLSLRLSLREHSSWKADPSMITTCQDKGQSEDDCHNYVMVLQNYGNLLYACGTYAFSPNCSWRQMENLTAVSYETGVAKCPFSPKANVTSLITESGYMFVGSPTDFSGSDFAILRADLSQSGKRLVRTKQYNSQWLNEPQFVGSFESGEFVYFVFREVAVEFMNCGKAIYSRIARVCKRDPSGDHILKDNWTSFLKARLNCSLPGDYPFYFDEVQGISYSSEEGILYATFSTSQNSIHGSAVCAYNLSSINAAFNGLFKHQESIHSIWKSVDAPYRSQYECQFDASATTSRHRQLLDSLRYQLMDQSVQPIADKPLHYSSLERFVHISIDTIATKTSSHVPILYVSTETGVIKKIHIIPRMNEACVIEIWQADSHHDGSKIHTIEFLKETESLYVGTDSGLMRIPAEHCHRHVSNASCLNAMDPYCGWNELKQTCSPAPNGNPHVRHWIQSASQCPLLTAPVDGGWSAWSDWFKCAQNTEQDIDNLSGNVDMCLCRRRTCNNPTPKNGGEPCKGIDILVSNCTVNGGWTEWSAWSSCSQTCGMAVKTRRRTCGNPKPAHGGRTCVGVDRQELYCPLLPPCPVPEEQPVDGGWGPWGSWSDCSAACGGGYRSRRRKCNNPQPRNGGLDCSGCHVEYEVCNTKSCPEIKKMSAWTPWLIEVNGSASDRGRLEKRYRFACRASVANTNLLRFDAPKEEKRICYEDGSCQRFGVDSENGEWTDWTPCSVSCGGGQQFRRKICDGDECKGKLQMARACNTQPCADWGCWGDWSPCSVSCGKGVRFRQRKCIGDDCEGNSREEDACDMGSCENSPYVLQAGLSATSIYSICFGVAVFCSSVSVILTMIYYKRKASEQARNCLPSSQCYGSYPNQYESLPTKDLNERRAKPKRQSSFNSGNKNMGHGTLTKATNLAGNYNTPKVLSKSFSDCESSTLKRNSQLNNARLHRNVDDEKF
ncbi:semaphorin-5B [Hermetia illucens]|nr:semaphorin-5B [Hermetia illucens]XP_037905899.1 semaphorin-5B [Hermetia illucens]